MNRHLPIFILFLTSLLFSCQREIEDTPLDMGLDFQPIEIGLYWIYEVDETIVYGENDAEHSVYFIQDRIIDYYFNEANEQTYIVQRSKSEDQLNWQATASYTLLLRNHTLVKTIANQPIVSLVFPINSGIIWNANTYRNEVEDNFEYLLEEEDKLRVNQENSDDLVTYRDIRFEVYQRGIGLIEKYEEVLTYCSRNDCLGDQLINSGVIRHLNMIAHGED